MPRRRVRRQRLVRVRRGGAWYNSLWNGIKSAGETVYNKALKPAWNAKLFSKGLALVPHPYAQGASKVVGALGGSRRRKVGGSRRGGRRMAGCGSSSLAGRLYLC